MGADERVEGAANYLAPLAGVGSGAQRGFRVRGSFEVYGFAGLHVLTNRTAVERLGDRYAIATDLDTRGLASVFVDLTSHSQVSGRLGSETPRPETYRADVRRNGAERHYAVDFRRDGTVINELSPPSLTQVRRNRQKRCAVRSIS